MVTAGAANAGEAVDWSEGAASSGVDRRQHPAEESREASPSMQQHAAAPDIGQTGAFPEDPGSAKADTDTSSATKAAIEPRSRNGGLSERSITGKINAGLGEIFLRQMLQEVTASAKSAGRA